MTASATAPPAPHNKLSRLPWIHRVRLEFHTDGEYAQKTEDGIERHQPEPIAAERERDRAEVEPASPIHGRSKLMVENSAQAQQQQE